MMRRENLIIVVCTAWYFLLKFVILCMNTSILYLLVFLSLCVCIYLSFLFACAPILVSQNNETVAMLVFQTNPLGNELFAYATAFFCSYKLV